MSLDYSDFDAAAFLELRFTLAEDNPKTAYVQDSLDFMHRFFQDYGSEHFDPTKTKAVEIGGGPSILYLISAATHVSEIVFTDYVPACLEQVDLWRKKAPSAFNWGPVFEYVAGKESPPPLSHVEVSRLQEKVRQKLTVLTLCDLTKDPIIDMGVVPQGGFDLLITSGAMEAAARSEEELFAMLHRCSNLVVAGGFMVVVLNKMLHTTYKVRAEDEKELHAFYISEDIFRRGLDQAGLSVEQFLTTKAKYTEFSPISQVHRIVCRKR